MLGGHLWLQDISRRMPKKKINIWWNFVEVILSNNHTELVKTNYWRLLRAINCFCQLTDLLRPMKYKVWTWIWDTSMIRYRHKDVTKMVGYGDAGTHRCKYAYIYGCDICNASKLIIVIYSFIRSRKKKNLSNLKYKF